MLAEMRSVFSRSGIIRALLRPLPDTDLTAAENRAPGRGNEQGEEGCLHQLQRGHNHLYDWVDLCTGDSCMLSSQLLSGGRLPAQWSVLHCATDRVSQHARRIASYLQEIEPDLISIPYLKMILTWVGLVAAISGTMTRTPLERVRQLETRELR